MIFVITRYQHHHQEANKELRTYNSPPKWRCALNNVKIKVPNGNFLNDQSSEFSMHCMKDVGGGWLRGLSVTYLGMYMMNFCTDLPEV